MKDFFQIIHIIGAVQAFFLFLVLIFRKENKTANKLLAALILLITANLTTSFFHENNEAINDLAAIGRSDMFIFAFGPLVTLYTQFLTGSREKFKPQYLSCFFPSFVLLVVLLISYTQPGRWHLAVLWDETNPFILKTWYFVHLASLLSLLACILYSLWTVFQYKKRLPSYFSQSGRIYLPWLLIILGVILFIVFIAILQFNLHTFLDPEGVLQWIISISVVLLVFVMGYFTFTQPDILQDLGKLKILMSDSQTQPHDEYQDAEKETRYKKNRLSEKEEKNNLSLLLGYMETQKPYLDSELNIRQLSEKVGIPAHQISMLLNIYRQQNFYTFVNRYRIEEAKIKLAEDTGKEQNILSIAFETGFNSKSTFNAVFKNLEGKTPSEYRARIIQQK